MLRKVYMTCKWQSLRQSALILKSVLSTDSFPFCVVTAAFRVHPLVPLLSVHRTSCSTFRNFVVLRSPPHFFSLSEEELGCAREGSELRVIKVTESNMETVAFQRYLQLIRVALRG